jgi:transcriptional regulator with XRE-family HTH domain
MRNRLGETQFEFAFRTKLAVSTLARYESGVQEPKAAVLKALSAVAEEQRFLDLAHQLHEGFQSRIYHRSRIRALKEQGVSARVASLMLLIDRCCKQGEEVNRRLKMRSKKHDNCPNEQLGHLLTALVNQEKMLRDLQATITRELPQSKTG